MNIRMAEFYLKVYVSKVHSVRERLLMYMLMFSLARLCRNNQTNAYLILAGQAVKLFILYTNAPLKSGQTDQYICKSLVKLTSIYECVTNTVVVMHLVKIVIKYSSLILFLN